MKNFKPLHELPNPPSCDDVQREYLALLAMYGEAQARCSEIIKAQEAEIRALRAEAMRLRAVAILRETALAWAHEDAAGQDLLAGDPGSLEASLVAADLVICQTGCLSHGAYWRVQDHCKRTGKACMLVERPDAVRIVRIHKERKEGADPVAWPAA